MIPAKRADTGAQHKAVHHPVPSKDASKWKGRVQLWDELQRPHEYEHEHEHDNDMRDRSGDGEAQWSRAATKASTRRQKGEAVVDRKYGGEREEEG
jgi:hypothetical protein